MLIITSIYKDTFFKEIYNPNIDIHQTLLSLKFTYMINGMTKHMLLGFFLQWLTFHMIITGFFLSDEK